MAIRSSAPARGVHSDRRDHCRRGLPAADALVAEAAAGPAGSEYQDYEAYNALAWITRHAPGLESAQQAFAQVQHAIPGSP